jgi:hypothetical protein
VKRATLCLLCVVGCITRPAPTPYPCDRIDEVPGLRAEMKALRSADDVRMQLRMMPASVTLRNYAKAASIACAGNRELGAQRVTPELPKTPWYRRLWKWIT